MKPCCAEVDPPRKAPAQWEQPEKKASIPIPLPTCTSDPRHTNLPQLIYVPTTIIPRSPAIQHHPTRFATALPTTAAHKLSPAIQPRRGRYLTHSTNKITSTSPWSTRSYSGLASVRLFYLHHFCTASNNEYAADLHTPSPTGIATRFVQLGIEMRPFFQRGALWVYPLFAGIGGSFGYWMKGVEDRQTKLLQQRKEIIIEKRRRRAEREANGGGAETAGVLASTS
jgi:hypothetical protein